MPEQANRPRPIKPSSPAAFDAYNVEEVDWDKAALSIERPGCSLSVELGMVPERKSVAVSINHGARSYVVAYCPSRAAANRLAAALRVLVGGDR